MPPLSVTRAEVDEAIAILEQTINECSAAPPRAGAQAR
jgi:4-aminobutyrate aminotransferase-like enzyme